MHFGRDEKLIQQGDDGDSMFVLVDGQATVVVKGNSGATPVAFLRSGDCFGEMSLLTGERRRATVIAQTDCEVVEIGKAVLARSLKEHPALLAQLSELLARRQLETEGILAAVESSHAVAALPDVLASTALDAARQRVAATPRGAAPAPLPREAVIVLGLSGRGDKDLAALGLKEVGR